MDYFIDHLVVFNPYWLVGALLFGFFASRIFQRGFIPFIAVGYVLFVFPTLQIEKMLRSSSIGSDIMRTARDWTLTPYDTASLMVALTAIIITGVFWALNQ